MIFFRIENLHIHSLATSYPFSIFYLCWDRKRVCKLQSKKNYDENGRCYDVIASGSTEDHIYDEIKGKLNKSSQQFN